MLRSKWRSLLTLPRFVERDQKISTGDWRCIESTSRTRSMKRINPKLFTSREQIGIGDVFKDFKDECRFAMQVI